MGTCEYFKPFLLCVCLKSYIRQVFFFLIERIKLETVNKDNFFKEFCYKGDQRNEEMTGTILFNLQQQLFEVGAIIIIPFLQMYKL